MMFFHKAGIYNKVGKDNFCENIDAALARATEIIACQETAGVHK